MSTTTAVRSPGGALPGSPRLWLLGAAALVAGYAALALPASAVDWLIQEDGAYETLGAVGLLVAGVAFLLSGVVTRRSGGARLPVLVLLATGAALILAAGEEISWGQRIVGLETPESIREANSQGETNLHNLEALRGVPDIAFQAFWMLGFIVLPLAALAAPSLRRFDALFPIVPLGVAALFLGTYVGAQIAEWLYVGGSVEYDSKYPVIHSITEVKEALVGASLGIAGLVIHRRTKARATAGAPPSSEAR